VEINNDTREDTRTTCLIEDTNSHRDGEGRGQVIIKKKEY